MLISQHRLGLRSVQIAEELGISRPSVDRDLDRLRKAGIPIVKETINGETRHRFLAKPLPPLQPTALQLAALRLARMALTPLEGSRFLREIDALLAGVTTPTAATTVSVRTGLTNPDVVKVLDSAIEHRRRVRLKYTAASHAGEAKTADIVS